MISFRPFIISVSAALDGDFAVTAEFGGIRRSGMIDAGLTLLADHEIDHVPDWVEDALDDDYPIDLGSRLFYTLFPLPILTLFREAQAQLRSDESIRLVIEMPLPQPLDRLPFELLYDPDGGQGFLARSCPVVRRYTDVPFPHKPVDDGPLRVLVAVASPPQFPNLSGDAETEVIASLLGRRHDPTEVLKLLRAAMTQQQSLTQIVQRLRIGRRFEVTTLFHTTPSRLQEIITQERSAGAGFHVIHFIGHGGVDEDHAYLVLEADEANGYEIIEADRFAEIVGDSPTNLVVLNACETGVVDSLFANLSHAVLARGVPAVIGTQTSILDEVAVEFSREFYRAWAGGTPIELSIAYARRHASWLASDAVAYWAVPVLYMSQTGGITLRPLRRVGGLLSGLNVAWRAAGLFLAALTTVGLLLSIPAMAKTIRTEVPYIKCVHPYPMDSNRFSIAFANFLVLDKNGTPMAQHEGQALASYLFERFAHNFEALDLDVPHQLRPPSQMCVVKGSTAAERSRNAAEVANEINADIIIYGVISTTVIGPRLELEFRVNDSDFEEAAELLGRHALGGPLLVDIPFEPDDLTGIANPPHVVRARVLSWIVIGLSHYFADDPHLAIQFFEMAEQERSWPSTDGKEIIYLLLGNAAIRLASIERDTDAIDDALNYYQKAVEIAPDYSRARIGYASALYLSGLGDPDDDSPDSIDRSKLWQAVDIYQEELNGPNAKSNPQFQARARLGLGQVYYVLGALDSADTQMMAKAQGEYRWLIERFEGGEQSIAHDAGHAYARLGYTARQEGRFQEALVRYRQAADLASPFYRARYLTNVAEIECHLADLDSARTDYVRAIDLARLYGYRRQVEEYVDVLTELERSGCPRS